MSKRRKYSAEFKREAVELTRQPEANCRQIALDIGINPNLLSRWKRESDQEPPSNVFRGSGTPRDEEVARLKRERAKIKQERDFLREAATYFAKGSS